MDHMIWGLIPGRSKKLFSSPECPNRLWGMPNLIFNVYWGFFSLE
jgi:hypothetical protein